MGGNVSACARGVCGGRGVLRLGGGCCRLAGVLANRRALTSAADTPAVVFPLKTSHTHGQADKSGSGSAERLASTLSEFGLAAGVVARLMRDADGDRSGSLEFAEFRAIVM